MSSSEAAVFAAFAIVVQIAAANASSVRCGKRVRLVTARPQTRLTLRRVTLRIFGGSLAADAVLLATVGFPAPHLSTLKNDDRQRYSVPILDIQRVTQLTFFAEAHLSPVKVVVDHRWLDMLV